MSCATVAVLFGPAISGSHHEQGLISALADGCRCGHVDDRLVDLRRRHLGRRHDCRLLVQAQAGVVIAKLQRMPESRYNSAVGG